VLKDQLLPDLRPRDQRSAEQRPDKPEEACGVFAVLAAGQPVANLTYFGLYALQHRGP
jgi:amidophosphoribosyltransferase